MTTVEERREVTRRLRECRSGWSSGECYYTIIHALGLPDTSREDGGAALYARLADLIEPSCDAAATRTDATATRDVSQCRRSDVDRDALLALADEMDHTDSEVGWTDDALPHFARRIRQELGVSDDA